LCLSLGMRKTSNQKYAATFCPACPQRLALIHALTWATAQCGEEKDA